MKHQFLTLSVAAVLSSSATVVACPYCVVESDTLTEEMERSDAVILATLVKPAAPLNEGPDDLGEFGVIDPDTGKATFRIDEVLLGQDLLEGVEEIEAVFFGEPIEGQKYFLRGVGVNTLDWNIPMPMSEHAVKYVKEIQSLPRQGPERMKYFLNYLQHEDPLLAQDSYDEFARAAYADVIGIKDLIDRQQLWEWIHDRDVSPSRRSLFFTMLGVCGQEEDIERLQKMMMADVRVLRSAAEASVAAGVGLGGAIALPIVPEMVSMDGRRRQLGFNAMVGCYLKLTGEDGLDVVDEIFLKDPDADPTKVYGVLIALRFLGEETDDVPMQRLIESMRLVLDKPDFAEQAITDLARWEDWSVLDRLVTMFKEADPRTYVKEPIIAYLDQAQRQPGDVGERATAALKELEEIDPEAVKRARSLLSFGFLNRARSAKSTTSEPAPGVDEPEDESFIDEPLEDPLVIETAADVENVSMDADEPEFEVPPEPTEMVAGAAAEDSETDDPSTTDGASNEVEIVAEATKLPASDAHVSRSEPNRLVVLGLPLVIAAGFVALVWVVLRGGA